MPHTVPSRSEIPAEYTWDVESVFPSDAAWETELEAISRDLPTLERFKGRLGESAELLLEWRTAYDDLMRRLGRVFLYGSMRHNVDTRNGAAKAAFDRAGGLMARAAATTAFAEPEILAIGFDTLQRWMEEAPELAVYRHYFDRLERRREHVRSSDVEEVLGLVRDPFSSAAATHGVLVDTDLTFAPARGTTGDEVEVAQGNINALLTDPDRDLRRTAWESYADAHLAFRNTLANCLASGVKQDVFMARARRYASSLEAALEPNHIPVAVFHNLIETFKANLPTWHRYWQIRRRGLGYDALHVYDIKAPLSANPPHVPYEQAVEWIVEGMRPLGDEYVRVLRNAATSDRWVDIYPNQGKRSGAYSSGSPGTKSFILMSYNDDVFSMSTLAHEFGHSMHSYRSFRTQPFVYARYGMFLAETASNFNQAMVRAHLLDANPDPDFQIAVIEEAMSNFHRYFFIMPTLARFELEIHERVERGEALTAESLISLMTGLFREGYGDEVVIDADRVGITWAQFPIHLYANFYVFQYATGISAANALARGVLEGGTEAAERYLSFLAAGGSMYPLDALELAGVDMSSPEPVQAAFGVMADMIERLAGLLEGRSAVPA